MPFTHAFHVLGYLFLQRTVTNKYQIDTKTLPGIMVLIKCLRGQQWHNQGSHVSVNESKTAVFDSVFIVCLHACNQAKH